MYPDYRKVVFPYKNLDGTMTWVVEFPDLPGCSAVGDTEADALAEAKTARDLWLDVYFEAHQSYTYPKERTSLYSGKVLLRLPKTLHKSLAEQADDEGVSLNTLMITYLAQNCGQRSSNRKDDGDANEKSCNDQG